jgi:uncharacterized Tic20 family protein
VFSPPPSSSGRRPVFAIIAAVKVSNGQTYRYPFTIRFN